MQHFVNFIRLENMNQIYIMKKLLFVLSFLFIIPIFSRASHIVGGEVYYDTVGLDGSGNMVYNVTFELFRECNAGAAFPGSGGGAAQFHFTVFNPNGTVFATYTLPYVGFTELPLVYDDPCVEPPDDVCIESSIYNGTVALPVIAGDYTIAYQVGWWSGDYINFTDPDQIGMTIETTVPGTDKVGNIANNSPRFSEYPQIVFCLDVELSIESSIIEEDGDSLVFKMCDPYEGAIVDLNPDPETPPPYNSIPWEPGFNANFPFNVGSPTNMNPITGEFTTTPSMLGKFVARFCVEEWRDGILINTHSRTFGYSIVVCDIEPVFEISVLGGGDIIEGCGGITFVIERNDTSGVLPLIVYTSGDAQMGYNYDNLPDTIFIPNGVTNDTIFVNTIFQPPLEGDLEGNVSILYLNPCTGDLDTASTSFTVLDYVPMQISIIDSINLCSDYSDQFMLTPESFTGGAGPFYFQWNNYLTTYPNNDTIVINSGILDDNFNPFSLTIIDQCGYEIQSPTIGVYNQCPLLPPNIITPNNDGSNEFFIIKNNNHYDRIHLRVFNRWGNLVYEDESYKDDWNGVDSKGTPLSEGVYFYTVLPQSDKFDYRDDGDLQLIHGYVHIVR